MDCREYNPAPCCSLESDVADFDGRSALLYRFNQKSMSTVKDVISLQFKSVRSDGVLVHSEGQRGDYITLELQRSRLALHINLGESRELQHLKQPNESLCENNVLNYLRALKEKVYCWRNKIHLFDHHLFYI